MYRSIRLNEHNRYVKLLDILAQTTDHIGYVTVDEDDTMLLDKFAGDIISKKNVNKWWGTKTSSHCVLYRINASPALFSFLKKFTTFCILETDRYGDRVDATDFGINDIAFFDAKPEPILFTTTHEGYIMLRKDIRFQ